MKINIKIYVIPFLLFVGILNCEGQSLDYLKLLGTPNVSTLTTLFGYGYKFKSITLNNDDKTENIFDYYEEYERKNPQSYLIVKYKMDTAISIKQFCSKDTYPNALMMLRDATKLVNFKEESEIELKSNDVKFTKMYTFWFDNGSSLLFPGVITISAQDENSYFLVYSFFDYFSKAVDAGWY